LGLVRNPVLFSERFGVPASLLAAADVFDPTLNADTKLFIDPLLLRVSQHPTIHQDAVKEFETYFSNIIRVLRHSKQVGDKPWRTVDEMFTFKEPKETCLGYGDRTTHGSALGPDLRAHIMKTASEIIALGMDDPELFVLMGLLERNIGPDRISDMTTHAIKPAILKFTENALQKFGIKTERFSFPDGHYQLVRNPFEAGRSAVFLVPRDILRPLPVVNSWDDVAMAAAKNAQLRATVNSRIGDIWAITTRKQKDEARSAVLQDANALKALMDAVMLATKAPYDAKADMEGHYLWRNVLTELLARFPCTIRKPTAETLGELERVVDEIIAAFADLIENKGNWIHLWNNAEARHERCSQRFFFAVAEVYCKANNLDVSPETDSGGGPVDFKFSSGYAAKVVVELKLSTGRVVHGYETQLEVYKSAAGTNRARYVIIDVGGMGKKLQKVFELKNAQAARGEPVSPITVVDGKRKQSASVRPPKRPSPSARRTR